MSNNTFTVCQASAGSGKTYTLAATYVAMLLSGEIYRTILAVTFTNKATAEMKERILLFLDNIARQTGSEADGALEAVKQHIKRIGITRQLPSDDELRRRAGDYYRRMLEDYDNIHISTIDTFLMQLLNGLGQMLDDSSATATVELDINQLITAAVDRMMTLPDDRQNGLRKRLEHYVNEQLEAEKDWDIRRQLRQIAKYLYGEAAQQLDAEGEIVFDTDKLRNFRQRNDFKAAACVVEAVRIYNNYKDNIPEKWMDSWFKRIEDSLNGTVSTKDAFRGPTDKQMEKPMPPDLTRLAQLCPQCRKAYFTAKCSMALINDLSLMSDIRASIKAIMAEQNTVLLAQTAQVLHEAMRYGDADFILEKAGIRYRHIMLDEFQDTSVLQWENFRPLLEDILSEGGTVFIVGDIKQSIYRWRNGDWRIMAGLSDSNTQLYNYYTPLPLVRNYRSEREVVKFNLDLFEHLGLNTYGDGNDLSQYYRAGHEDGYVRVRCLKAGKDTDFEDKQAAQYHIAEDMFRTMEQRLAQGANGSDMLILSRGHKEVEVLIDVFRTLTASGDCPLLQQVGLVSCDSFHIDSSPLVCRIIDLVRYIVHKDAVSQYALKQALPELDIDHLDETISADLPLIELLQESVKLILGVVSSAPDDSAYISSLMDAAIDYTNRYGADAAQFLSYWDDTLHSSPVAAPESDSVKIMTIHVAKGLEAKQVYIPFCNWKMEEDRADNVLWCRAMQTAVDAPDPELRHLPIPMSKAMGESAYQSDYDTEHAMQRTDNINLLYVAFTRAGEELYIYTDSPQADWPSAKTTGAVVMNYIGDKAVEHNEWFEYSVGAPKHHVTDAPKDSSGKMDDRCSFSGAEKVQLQWHIGERTPEFRQTIESVDFLQYGEQDDNERALKIALGTVCHSIMEQMITREDEQRALRRARLDGRIVDDAQLAEVTKLIDQAWTNPDMCNWFSGEWELLREVAFLDRGREFRPDRVMINRQNSHAIVLDYKFGERELSYPKQVRQYMSILKRSGFNNVEGFIWYAKEAELEQVKEGRS